MKDECYLEIRARYNKMVLIASFLTAVLFALGFGSVQSPFYFDEAIDAHGLPFGYVFSPVADERSINDIGIRWDLLFLNTLILIAPSFYFWNMAISAHCRELAAMVLSQRPKNIAHEAANSE